MEAGLLSGKFMGLFGEKYKIIGKKAGKKGIRFQELYVLVILFGITVLHFPNSVMYLTDLVWAGLFFFSLERINAHRKSNPYGILFYIGLLGTYTLLLFLINHQSVLYYLWGLRNTFRFFAFFAVCICWMEINDIWKILNVFEVFVYANVIVCSWQYWICHMPYDNICGLFGATTQGGGYMNVLLVIVTIVTVFRYLKNQISLRHFLCMIGSCVYISVISELKAYFFELGIIVAVSLILIFMEKRAIQRRLVFAAVVAGIGMLVIAVCTVALNPGYWEGFFLPQGVWEEVTRESGYSAQGDLNRLTAIGDIFRDIFQGKPRALIGFGLGNCDYSGFAFLTTPFYQMYKGLNYVWIHVAFLFLELGFIGLILYGLFFFFVGRKAWCNLKNDSATEEERILNYSAILLSICCIFFMFYNVCLRTEAAYMIFLILAVPYCTGRKKNGDV